MKQVNEPDSSVLSEYLSLDERRGPEYQHLFKVLKQRKTELCSWRQIIESVLDGAFRMQLEALLARGMFCDGFDFPKARDRTKREIEATLDHFDLHVHNINLHSSKDYAFVQLEEEGHVLSTVIGSLRSLFDKHTQENYRKTYSQLRDTSALSGAVPHLKKIDLT